MPSFNPIEDPDAALAFYHSVDDNTASAADTVLFEYIKDQAEHCDLILDIETTELIDVALVPLANMQVSVASLLFLEAPSAIGAARQRFLHVFWGSRKTGRGAPLKFLRHALDHTSRIVAYNGNFDLTVLAQGEHERLERWRKVLFDPFANLKKATEWSFSLNALLVANGLEAKTASGKEAPAMWQRWLVTSDTRELVALEKYNQRDVIALAQLVELDRVWLPKRPMRTKALRLPMRFPVFPLGAPQSLVQNSPEWREFRRGKIGASMAPSFVRQDFRTSRAEAFELLLAPDDARVDTVAMARGRDQEAPIANTYAAKYGFDLAATGSWPHPDNGTWLFASPDRLATDPVNGQFGILEVKSVSAVPAEPTNANLIQVALQLACCPLAEWCDLALGNVQCAQVPESDNPSVLRVFRVLRDADLINFLILHLRAVWQAAAPFLNGNKLQDYVTVDDVASFNRSEELELKKLLYENRTLFVTLR